MRNIEQVVKPILVKYGVKKASFFGSYARGDYDDQSDIDILFDPPKNMGISYLTLRHELEDTLQKKVDLVSYSAINKHLKESILQTQQTIL
ncbi:MAG: nucleotidyltransferase domain-containing protein [Candidatus Roizmanbacteria bacterium]|nr:nucleotidyltransferase domain-containing protein [Candidatus Roizmanbacteria bacterium]